jgi:hypothetical protein
MNISEIILTPERSDDITKFLHVFTDATKSMAFNRLQFGQIIQSDEHHLGLFDQDKLVSYLRLDVRTQGYWQITYSQTEPPFQGQGCFRYLLVNYRSPEGHAASCFTDTPRCQSYAWQS